MRNTADTWESFQEIRLVKDPSHQWKQQSMAALKRHIIKWPIIFERFEMQWKNYFQSTPKPMIPQLDMATTPNRKNNNVNQTANIHKISFSLTTVGASQK